MYPQFDALHWYAARSLVQRWRGLRKKDSRQQSETKTANQEAADNITDKNPPAIQTADSTLTKVSYSSRSDENRVSAGNINAGADADADADANPNANSDANANANAETTNSNVTQPKFETNDTASVPANNSSVIKVGGASVPGVKLPEKKLPTKGILTDERSTSQGSPQYESGAGTVPDGSGQTTEHSAPILPSTSNGSAGHEAAGKSNGKHSDRNVEQQIEQPTEPEGDNAQPQPSDVAAPKTKDSSQPTTQDGLCTKDSTVGVIPEQSKPRNRGEQRGNRCPPNGVGFGGNLNLLPNAALIRKLWEYLTYQWTQVQTVALNQPDRALNFLGEKAVKERPLHVHCAFIDRPVDDY